MERTKRMALFSGVLLAVMVVGFAVASMVAGEDGSTAALVIYLIVTLTGLVLIGREAHRAARENSEDVVRLLRGNRALRWGILIGIIALDALSALLLPGCGDGHPVIYLSMWLSTLFGWLAVAVFMLGFWS